MFAKTTAIAQSHTSVVATGGTITTVSGFRYHVFTAASGNWVLTSNATNLPINVLIVGGGGGGGGGWFAAGGGAGGLVTRTLIGLSNTTYPIVVGGGGSGNTGNGNTTAGVTGGNSTCLLYTSPSPRD